MDLILAYLDQFRYMTGILAICIVLCHKALTHKTPYLSRICASAAVFYLMAFAYVPLRRMLEPLYRVTPLAIAPYWLLMSFVPVLFVFFCYETNWAGALFRAMMASFTETILTVLIRNLFVYTLFPDFPHSHPFLYMLGMIVVYLGFYWSASRVLGERIRADEMARLHNDRTAALIFLFIFLSFTAILSAAKYAMEDLILPIAAYAELKAAYRYLQFFLVGIMLVLCIVMQVILWYIYKRTAMQTEKEIIARLVQDRKSQYEFSKENIEMINRKTHDLKHQLQALAMVSDDERKRQIQETSRAIDFYDAVVKTGNEALDILLTEKSVYCANRQIRLSCMVNTRQLQKIKLVDLYTLLGNALDNAIESTERISDPERKVISLSILDQGNMLYIQLENYFEGELQMQDGLPRTRKKDAENHGYGLKSIVNIVHSYDGKIEVRTEGEIFYLEIMIP
ncbi:MAG: GHKL domain-containing protein [Clostridia bacterium]|nr:GHKL domain-containing protein [Clostridia bacterium]